MSKILPYRKRNAARAGNTGDALTNSEWDIAVADAKTYTLLTRQQALMLGRKRYFTGKPCVHNHISPRKTTNRACVECAHILNKEKYHGKSIEERQIEQKAYREKNRESINAGQARRRRENLNRYQRYELRQKKQNPIPRMLWAAKNRAKKKNLQFDLTRADIVIPPNCPCCNRILVLRDTFTERACDDSPSLDRVDNNHGYIRGNVVVICWRCNAIKYNATSSELRMVADWIDSFLAQRRAA